MTLYNGKCEVCLDSLRYKHYCSKVASDTTHVQSHTMPPTSAAAKYHSIRVYYQMQQWKERGWFIASRLGVERK